jgi:hypothetical protein
LRLWRFPFDATVVSPISFRRMAEEHREPSPLEFRGNFAGFLDAVQKQLERNYGEDADGFESVAERALAEAPFVAARTWLVERWGSHFPCPACQNTQWTVSEMVSDIPPAGFLSFGVTCSYCGNTMYVAPGRAEQDEPIYRDEQIQFPVDQ